MPTEGEVVGEPTTLERQLFYCVPTPGETVWARDMYAPVPAAAAAPTPATSTKPKRERDADEDGLMDVEPMCGLCEDQEAAEKKARNPLGGVKAPAATVPAPKEVPGACLVKLYDADAAELKICDVVEFYGVLSFDPVLAPFADGEVDLQQEEMLQAPNATVPRLHCLAYRKLTPEAAAYVEPTEQVVAQLAPELAGIRSATVETLAAALGGDRLAAEYLLLHLISSVHTRTPTMLLGKFALNLCRGEEAREVDLVGPLRRLLESLLPRCLTVPLTLKSLSAEAMYPVKDYSSNRLRPGVLQCAARTQLVVDQTCLEGGELKTLGVTNVARLSNVISQQRLEYDFQFYQQAFETDAQTLVISDGKGLFPVDAHVYLRPTQAPADCGKIGLAEAKLSAMRRYLAAARCAEYGVTEAVAKMIEEDFIAARAADPTVSAETLSHWMQVARLVALSSGGGELTKGHWEHARGLERERLSRMPPPLPTKAAPTMPQPAAAPTGPTMEIPVCMDEE